jgi:phosphate transport system substrate-binding protein
MKKILAIAALLFAACQPNETAPAAKNAIRLQGAGSTFDNPLFSKVFDAYQKKTGVEVNYQSIGSGGGVQQLTKGVVDFGATDFPLNGEQTKSAAAAGGAVVHIPVTMGAVSIGYNLPLDGVKLDGPTVAAIYLGTIAKWNDPKIAALNRGVALPNMPIAVVHRAEGSGTTFIFSSFLAAVSPEWKSKIGAGGALKWPAGIGAKGSEGVAGQVLNTPGAIGYFEMAYANQNHVKPALIKNAAEKFVAPSVQGVADAAASAASNMPADLKAMFVNAPGETSYPISGFSWIVVFQQQKDAAKGKAIADLLKFVVHDGQQYAQPLDYAPLPKAVQDLDDQAIATIRIGR